MWCGRRPSPLATTSARRLGTGDRSPPAPRQNEPGISPTDIELRTLSDQDRTVSAGVIHRLRYVAHRALWGYCAAADGRRSSSRWALHAGGPPGFGCDGHRLPGPLARWSTRRGETRLRGARRGVLLPRPVPPRGGEHAQGRRFLDRGCRRRRPRRTPPVGGHRVHRGAHAGRVRAGQGAAVRRRGVRAGSRARRSTRLRARGGRGPPRPQARQHPHLRRRAEGHRLRHLPCARPDHPHRHRRGHRHAGLHVTRAGRSGQCRSRERRVLARGSAGLRRHRQRALRRGIPFLRPLRRRPRPTPTRRRSGSPARGARTLLRQRPHPATHGDATTRIPHPRPRTGHRRHDHAVGRRQSARAAPLCDPDRGGVDGRGNRPAPPRRPGKPILLPRTPHRPETRAGDCPSGSLSVPSPRA